MRVVIAPQSFKGSLSAPRVAEAMATGIKRVVPAAALDLIPLADGGEGTVEALVAATGGERRWSVVTGPLGERVAAEWGILGDGGTAVIEMAAASGLPLVPTGKRNPLFATTYGTGELIKKALDAGCRKLIVGIGGSATNDGGAGMAQALGAHLLKANDDEIGWGGAQLAELDRISVDELDSRLRATEVLVAADVTNPLCGPLGASAVYGPQKGATPEMVALLDEALGRYAGIIARDLGLELKEMPGAGAAGGLGAGLVAFLSARLLPGIDIVLDAVGLRRRLAKADLAVSGEGQLDEQTAYGKTVAGVAKLASRARVPLLVVAGGLGEGYESVYALGVDAIVVAAPGPVGLSTAMENAFDHIASATERAFRLLQLGGRIGYRGAKLP